MGKRILAAGHICLDITPVFPQENRCDSIGTKLVPGKLLQMQGVDVHTGGSVANTGLALKYLGADVKLLGKVGRDAFGDMVCQILKNHGADGLITDEHSATSYSVVLAVPGLDRIFLHDPGANGTFSGSDIPDAALENAALLHFGYPPLMPRMYANGGRELTELFQRAKAHGVATSLDMASVDPDSPAGQVDWERFLKNVLPLTDFFVPSFEELCFMLDREKYEALWKQGGDILQNITMERDARPLAQKCLAMGCGAVLIKCGTVGMYYMTGARDRIRSISLLDADVWVDRQGCQPCFRAECVRSATGAGDTSIAAFLMAACSGREPSRCAALAAAEGACAVSAYDALSGLKTLAQLEQMIDAGWETM